MVGVLSDHVVAIVCPLLSGESEGPAACLGLEHRAPDTVLERSTKRPPAQDLWRLNIAT